MKLSKFFELIKIKLTSKKLSENLEKQKLMNAADNFTWITLLSLD